MTEEKDEQEDPRWHFWDACLRNGRSAAEEGRHADAEELFNKALAEANQLEPGNWRSGHTLYNLAYYGYLNQNKLDEAKKTFLDALELSKSATGLPEAERINELQACLEGLAGVCFKMKNSEAAAAYAQQIMAASPQLGSRNHAASQLINVIARGYAQQGQADKALELCRSTLPLAETIYGAQGHQLLRLLELYAGLLRQNQNADQATALDERVEKIKASIQKNPEQTAS